MRGAQPAVPKGKTMDFDFTTIPQNLESLDGVPDRFKQFYDKDGDEYKLTDLAPLKNANERVKRERDEWKDKASSLSEWQALGESPDAIKTKLEELESAASGANETDAAAQVKSVKEQMIAQHEAEKKTWREKIEAAKNELGTERNRFNRTLIELDAVEAIRQEKGVPELLKALVVPHLSLVEKNGVSTTQVLQDNHSLSMTQGTIRGLHFQAPPHAQDKMVRCGRGALFDVAVDIRKGSPTYGQWFGVELSFENGKQLLVPAGFAHGFVTRAPETEIIYKCSDYYAQETEGAVAWDDPQVGIDWGLGDMTPVLSDKDANAPALADLNSPFTFEGV